MAKCPNCDEQILSDASKCPACTASFTEGAVWRPILQSPDEEEQLRQRYAKLGSNVVAESAKAGNGTTAANSVERRYPVEFTASTGEYFRIWIVNLALTILTIGIYSAWAKVRKKRYFYAHTRIDGENFEYRANPIAILKGRIIAVGALALFYGVGQFAPSFQWVFFIAAIFVVPWLLVRSMAFNAYNTAYRNIRLHFRGTYGACLKLLLIWGPVAVFTGGLGYPHLKIRLVRFAAENHFYGATQFAIGDINNLFHHIYLKAFGLGFLLVVGAIAFGFANFGEPPSGGAGLALTVGGYIGYLLIFAFIRARIANATFNHLTLGPVHFGCKLGAFHLFWLYVVNIIAIIVTLGLATSWAVVRTMRYRAEKMTLLATGGLESFVAAESAPVSAAGEEVGEMFDVDIGL